MSCIASATSSPEPLYLTSFDAESASGGDAMAQFLAAMQALSQSQLDLSTQRIHGTRNELDTAIENFLKKLAEACAALHEAEDGGGWFSDMLGGIASALGDVLGTIADFAVDAIVLPVEAGIAIGKNLGDPAAMMQALRASTLALGESGGVAKDVAGFTEGVVRFGADLAEFSASFAAGRLADLAAGRNPLNAMGGDLQKLWGSLKENVIDNPHFWAVASAAAKAGAVAATAMTGGALGAVAIGLIVALEVDNRTGIIAAVVGEDAAPWVRVGLQAAAALAMGVSAFTSGSSSVMASTLRLASGVTQGGNAIYQGYTALRNANERADQLENQAELRAALHRAQTLQRLLATLVEQLKSDSEDDTKTRDLSAMILQSQASANAAAVIPA